MDSQSEILMSAKELGCRRVNQQNQRYLTCLLRQLDLEKKMVKRDWDHRIKTLTAQKKKRMPELWDQSHMRRPRTAWNTAEPQNQHKFHVISRANSAKGTAQISPSIPQDWKLCASYRVLTTGERILQPPPKTSKLTSARLPTSRRFHTQSRRAISAPAKKSERSFLITQQENEEDLDEIIRVNRVSMNKDSDCSKDLLQQKPYSSNVIERQKADIALSSARSQKHSKEIPSCPKQSLSSNSSSSLQDKESEGSAGSCILLKQLTEVD